MPITYSKPITRSIFLFSFALAICAMPALAQNNPPNYPGGTYYRQAYDQGFRAGQSDYRAGRNYNYSAALIATAGVTAISKDYRTAFRLGYQDGYSGHNRNSEWYYRHHQHNSDCREEGDDRGPNQWGCSDHHDNGRHNGWYKHHHAKEDNQGNEDRGDEDRGH